MCLPVCRTFWRPHRPTSDNSETLPGQEHLQSRRGAHRAPRLLVVTVLRDAAVTFWPVSSPAWHQPVSATQRASGSARKLDQF